MKISGIYKITNTINKHFYIGSSNDIHRRWREHRNTAINVNRNGHNYPLYNAMRKYGIDNFDFTIIEQIDNPQFLIKREKFHYNKLQPYYNLIEPVSCPTFNRKHTVESREKISKNNSKYWLNKKLPKAMIESIIKGNSKKRISIIMIDAVTEQEIQVFDGVCNALRFLNKNPNSTNNIKRACNDFTKTAYGYKWKIVNFED